MKIINFRPEPFVFSSKREATDDDDVFHFVSYIHQKNSIFEIDGLREGPILIQEGVENKDWINKIKPIILERINLYANNEIKFNLLALIPDKKVKFQNEKILNENKRAYILKKLNKEIDNKTNNSNDIDVIILFKIFTFSYFLLDD